MSQPLSAPPRRNLLREAFAGLDMIDAPLAFVEPRSKETRNAAVVVLPGFGANDLSTAPLRAYLARAGFETRGWGLGFNLGGRGLIEKLDQLSDKWDIDASRVHNGEGEVPALIDKVAGWLRAGGAGADKEMGRATKLHLVGWSLGGYIAREVARDLPDLVASVVTMGSPVQGGPKYTAIAPYFRARNFDLDWIDEETRRRFDRPITQPVTAIYSKADGIVGWRAAVDELSPNVENIEVGTSHFGIGINRKVWRIVRDALIAADDALAP